MVSRWIWFLLVVLGMIFTSRSCHEILYQGVTPGPDFIEELRSGTVSRKNVIGVHILDYAGTGIWPFVEEDYRQLERVSIRPESAVEELLDLLERHSTKGHKYRNHPPGPDRIGVLRFETSDGGVYYLYYKLTYYQRAWHVGVSANSRGSTNPNGAQPYENIPLAEFLWKHDTFWQREKKGGRFPSTPPPGSE